MIHDGRVSLCQLFLVWSAIPYGIPHTRDWLFAVHSSQSFATDLILRLSSPWLPPEQVNNDRGLPAKVFTGFCVYTSYGFTVHECLVIHKLKVLFYIIKETIKLLREAPCFNN